MILLPGRHDSEDDFIAIDWNRGIQFNLLDTLRNIVRELGPENSSCLYAASSAGSVSSSPGSKNKMKLGYLNMFTKLCESMTDQRIKGDVFDIAKYLGFFPEEIFCW
jgi:hypothetical protein